MGSTRDVVYIALFGAVMAALAVVPPFTLPLTGVPITAQSLGPMLAGAAIGWKRAFLSQVLFLALVAAGLPLLAGGRGGIGVFFGPSGGFLLGWPIAALVIGWLFERYWAQLTVFRAASFIFIGGVVLLYLIGNLWVSVVAGMTLWQATVAGLPFLPGDIVKVGVATIVAMALKQSYPLIPQLTNAGDDE